MLCCWSFALWFIFFHAEFAKILQVYKYSYLYEQQIVTLYTVWCLCISFTITTASLKDMNWEWANQLKSSVKYLENLVTDVVVSLVRRLYYSRPTRLLKLGCNPRYCDSWTRRPPLYTPLEMNQQQALRWHGWTVHRWEWVYSIKVGSSILLLTFCFWY